MDRSPAELLQQIAFTAELPASMVAELAAISTVVQFKPGEIMFREGAENEVLYLIAGGHVALDMHVPGRGQMRVLSLGPGDVLAWSAVLSQGRMTATARSLEIVDAVAVCGKKLLAACERNPTLGYTFMRQLATALSKRLVSTRLQMLDVFGAHE